MSEKQGKIKKYVGTKHIIGVVRELFVFILKTVGRKPRHPNRFENKKLYLVCLYFSRTKGYFFILYFSLCTYYHKFSVLDKKDITNEYFFRVATVKNVSLR